jgi:peptidoglycan-associated lipoprotein
VRGAAHLQTEGIIRLKRKLYLNLSAALAVAIFGSACAKKKLAADPPHTAAPVAAVTPAPAPAERTPAPEFARRPETAVSAPASRFPDAATRARIEELLGHIQDAYFDYNRHTLRDDAVATLAADSKELANILRQFPDYKLRVEGYCDERGSAEYNLALGEARAKAAKDYLVSAGVDAGQLSTVSYGKEKPVCEEPDEACWSKNRRVHIIALK